MRTDPTREPVARAATGSARRERGMRARLLLRFAGVGGLLFLAQLAWRATAGGTPPAPPGTPLADDELLFRVALARGEHHDDALVRRRLARNLRFARGDADPGGEAELEGARDAERVDEALALGLHETDPVVRRRLIQRQLLRAHAAARRAEPDDAELRAWFARHAERWQEPARVRIRQVPADGKPLPIPRELGPRSEAELAGLLGPDFARAVFALPVGVWSEPLASAYGTHRVYVHARSAAAPARFESVRAQVREALLAERGDAALRAELARLRERYRIPVPTHEEAGIRRAPTLAGARG